MTTEEMIQALVTSDNNLVKRICTDIMQGRDTIAHQKTICGKFLQNVFDGKYEDAFRVADNLNKHAFIRYLIKKEDYNEVNNLIKKTGFVFKEEN